ncbi:MAG: adenylate kinase [alpha proteobacterium MED-G10]|nr:MAG: adenylate kinase [alpha proteobacterium MED-G10]|tara:strand:- start:732 stop:1307 length:576 start_codon:yes stop_codon:yes gene_type:complete
MKKVVLLGPPGSGKGTQSKFLVEKFGFIQISTGDLLRDQVQQKDSSMGKEISEIMNNGELVPDEIVIKLIIGKITIFKEKNIIFDGFPRNINQAKVLDESLEKISVSLDKAIFINVDYEILKERIISRINESGDDNKRSDDNVQTLVKRIDVYKKNTLPIVEYYKEKGILSEINGMLKIEEVSQQILKIIS